MTTQRFLFIDGVKSFLDKEFTEEFSKFRDSLYNPVLENFGNKFFLYDYDNYSKKENEIILDFLRAGPCLLEDISSKEGKDATLKLIKDGLLKEFDPKNWKNSYGYGWQLEECGEEADSMLLEDSEVIAFNF